MTKVLQVGLENRGYPIHIEADCAELIRARIDALASESRKCVVLLDRCVAQHQREFVRKAFDGLSVLSLPGGEKTKSLAVLGEVYDFLAAEGLDRTSCLIVAGGGVIGDLGGFAAASYLRGIDFFQVPTTLLAMVDSSVGGKTGINISAGKNLVGAFHQPGAVYIGTRLLETLPETEFNAGMAEVIKYGLLADAALFRDLAESGRLSPSSTRLSGIIHRCCEIKAGIVRVDEREQAKSGGRALLNLGHTFAHAIEQASGYREYLHGEAVALGLILAAELSRELGYLRAAEVDGIRRTVETYRLPVALRSPLRTDELLAAMKRDKKARGGRMRFVVMRRIGEAITADEVDEAFVSALWEKYGARK